MNSKVHKNLVEKLIDDDGPLPSTTSNHSPADDFSLGRNTSRSSALRQSSIARNMDSPHNSSGSGNHDDLLDGISGSEDVSRNSANIAINIDSLGNANTQKKNGLICPKLGTNKFQPKHLNPGTLNRYKDYR